MAKHAYLICPKDDSPGYYGMEVIGAFGLGATAGVADLSMPTVAAFIPESWTITICDERAAPVDLGSDADVIAITGKSSQRNRMIELADHFRGRGQLTLIGGPYASLNPDDVRDHCDILFHGEMEEIGQQLFSDIDSGSWQQDYFGGKADLSKAVLPRWDLYPRRAALTGIVQTSRGCPFECEFCDVIAYMGRKQRHKPVEFVLAELDQLHDLGYRSVFLADDNFTVHRRRAKELLVAIGEWNRQKGPQRLSFITQVSIDAARDEEMLELCSAAGLRSVFIGIETPNKESLRETKKRQNLGIDIVAELEKFLAHGICVMGGVIAGFDGDGPDIFDILEEFIDRIPVPIVSIGSLVAPPQTPLYSRLKEEGRLRGSDSLGGLDPFHTNVVPKQMSQEALLQGIQRLCKNVYSTAAFEKRMSRMMDMCRSSAPPHAPIPSKIRMAPRMQKLVRRFASLGIEEKQLCERIFQTAVTKQPDVRTLAFGYLFRYIQVRYAYHANGLWPIEPTKPVAMPLEDA